MGTKKFSELTAATTPLDYDEIIAIIQDSTSKKVAISEILASVNTIQLNTSPTPGAHSEGKLYWDANAGTLAVMTDVTDVVLQVGQETYVKARNNTGAQIDNGKPVYITGAIGERPTIALAQADSLSTFDVLGLATEDIANNADGYITVRGLVRDVDTSTFGNGDTLYLSSTVAGALQNTVPATGYSVKVGRVIYSNGSNGIILVDPYIASVLGDPANGDYLEILHDGTVVLHGNATSFKDELQPLAGSTNLYSPSADFEIDADNAAVEAKTSARYPTDYMSISCQMNHDYLVGSNIEPHLHWEQTTANTPNWLLAYRWQIQGSAKVTAWTLLPWTSNVFTWSSGTLNQITEFGEITPPVGYGPVSDIVQFKIYRDYTNASGEFGGADPVNASQLMLNFDVHKQVNGFGSREEYE